MSKKKYGINTKKILFFSLFKIESLKDQGIYPDLLGEFSKKGYELYILSPSERGQKIKKKFSKVDNVTIIQVKSLKTQKTNRFEKLASSLLLEFLFIWTYYRKLSNIKFDLVLFPTPTIFVTNFLKIIRLNKTGVKYLLIKDIFPQNAIDLNFIKQKSILSNFFENKEKKLYSSVDYIGCMSNANLKYLKDKKSVDTHKLEVNPNSIDISKYPLLKCNEFRKAQKISLHDLVFVYGGNLGKPQGINKILNFMKYIESKKSIHFIICGQGTESDLIKKFIKKHKIIKTRLFTNLSKQEYLQIVKESNIGLVFLHNSFSIPNYPSRILDYMYYKLPVLSWTDKASDVGDIFKFNNAGFSFKSENSFGEIKSLIDKIDFNQIKIMGENSHKILIDNFQSKHSFSLIEKKIN